MYCPKELSSALKKVATTLTTALLLTSSTISSADDTDIFLSNPNYDSSIKPNVLFILDNSGSMGNHLQDGKTRLQVMQEAFTDIMNNSSNINVGLMKLWARNDETSELTFPVTDIDANMPGTVISRTGVPELLASTDDAYEFLPTSGEATGNVTTGSGTLLMGSTAGSDPELEPDLAIKSFSASASTTTDSDGSPPQLSLMSTSGGTSNEVEKRVGRYEDNIEGSWSNTLDKMALSGWNRSGKTNGLYFRDLAIPQNAIIENAYIEFTAAENDNGELAMEIYAEQSKNPEQFHDDEDIEDRISTGSSTEWQISDSSRDEEWYWKTGTKYQTPDISQTIQSVLDNSSLNWGTDDQLNNLVLLLKFDRRSISGIRRVYQYLDYGNDQSKAAKLFVRYTVPQTLPGDYLTGVRFQNVGIPQDSIITSAKLEFIAAADDSESVTLKVTAGTPDGTSTDSFSNTTSNLSSRSRDQLGSVIWEPDEWTIDSDLNPGRHEVDIQPIVQELVTHSGWCGNDSATFFIEKVSGSGKREAYSYDGAIGKKPRLVIEYTPPTTGGCINEILSTRIYQEDHDGYEDRSGGYPELYDTDLKLQGLNESSTQTYTALHYQSFPIKQGATIIDARLDLTASEYKSGDIKLRIMAENKDNTYPLINQYQNIKNRRQTLTSNKIDWVISQPWNANETYRSPDITDVIQEIVDRDGWLAGNGLTLLVNALGTGAERYVFSNDGNPTFSPRLTIKVASGGIDSGSAYKVKDHLTSLVNQIVHGGGTPIVPRMYDAARYYQDSFDGQNSPITNACQSNHLVILTDGEANSNTSDTVNGIRALIGSNSCSGDSDERCGRDLSNWLATTDLKDSIERDNVVNTHTIAFAANANNKVEQFMRDLADEGDGEYYTADNAQDLAAAFNKIVNDILDNESTFASPGVAANSFNRSEHLNKVYYSIFKPSLTDRWRGNVKKYQLLGNPVSLHDHSSTPKEAVDESTGFFKDDALSFWSNLVDGGSVETGGAAGELPLSLPRKMFTFLDDNPAGATTGNALDTTENQLVVDNGSLSPTHFGLSEGNNTRRDELINWIRNPDTGMGDPLHSTPALVNYSCSSFSSDNPFYCDEDDLELVLFVGTNDGLFHAIDAQDGSEIFSFMPKELLPNLDALESNNSTDRTPGNGRPYGLDGHVVLWVNDANHNGVIYGGADTSDPEFAELDSDVKNSGEFVYAYVGMRRGGRNYYALDVTSTSEPKMLWYIKGGEGDFTRLGQTWSRPIKTRIRIGSNVRDVLIFSGGYDTGQDSAQIYREDEMGNAIYIVDARTGEKIWSASGAESGHDLRLSKMKYSIPGGVSVADWNGNGIADQLFFADTGGQVWRLYINNCKPEAQEDGSTSIASCLVKSNSDIGNLVWPADSNGDGVSGSSDGVIAYAGYEESWSDSAKRQHARRFYTRPDIVAFAMNGTAHLGVAIGSGNRSDPLGLRTPDIEDRFYFFTSPHLYNPVYNSEDEEDTVPSHSQIRDTSSGTLTNLTDPDATGFGSDGNQGWYINMNSEEKVMSDPAILDYKIYFNTYLPSDGVTNGCSAVAGSAWNWTVSFDATEQTRQQINSNGIVGNSVIVRLDPNSIGNGESDGDGDGGESQGDKENITTICNGTHCEQIETGYLEGSTYWQQLK